MTYSALNYWIKENNMNECLRVKHKQLSTSYFKEQFVHCNAPVIIEGAMEKWPALQLWKETSYFQSLPELKETIVEAYETPWVKFSITNKKLISFYTFCDTLFEDSLKNKYLHTEASIYLSNKEKGELGTLSKDIKVPPYVDSSLFLYSRIFLGKDTLTACHYHPQQEAFLCQIIGDKTVVLFPPSKKEFFYLYPHSWHSNVSNWSQIDFTSKDFHVTYPNLKKAIPYIARLKPGDMLFIPIYWWHLVYGENLSISVSHFWQSSLYRRYLTFLGLRSNYYWWLKRGFMRWLPTSK
jgi:hypothetical protein